MIANQVEEETKGGLPQAPMPQKTNFLNRVTAAEKEEPTGMSSETPASSSAATADGVKSGSGGFSAEKMAALQSRVRNVKRLKLSSQNTVEVAANAAPSETATKEPSEL